MKNCKGQITIFIILGILLLIIISALLISKNYEFQTDKSQIVLKNKISTVKSYIESCVENVGEKGIEFIALQGGYYNATLLSITYSGNNIPYYWYNSNNYMPQIEIIEQELANYIEENLQTCTSNFSSFRILGYEIKEDELNVNVDFLDGSTLISLDYPLKIIYNDSTTDLEDFAVNLDYDFLKYYNIIDRIIGHQGKFPYSVPIGNLIDEASKSNFTFETLHSDNSVIFILTFNDTKQLKYAFGSIYKFNNITGKQEKVIIEPIPVFNIRNHQKIEYKVNAFGNNLTFFDDSDLFDIEPKTGIILLDTLSLTNAVTHVLIKAVDYEGNQDQTVITFNLIFPDKKPLIDPIGNLTAFVNQEFNYTVQANDPSESYLLYLDDTSLFDINTATGEIIFTPNYTGNYTIKITALNKEGHTFQYMRLEIT
ncbi:MAG: Ig domain-containing protein [Candidatus Woesearchaeota archaeon]